MNILRIERLYYEKGLENCKLKTIDDLSYIHGVKLEDIEGYLKLSIDEKKMFKKFIVNFYNAASLKNRELIIPLKVYIALEKKYVTDTKDIINLPVRDIIVNAKTKSIEKYWKYDKLKGANERLHEVYKYMRLEYAHGKEKEWLHVNNEKSWY